MGFNLKNLEEIKLGLTINEIKETTKAHFSKLLKQKIREAAFKYLVKKQGKKGGDIKYSGLQMANYLQPYISNLSIVEKQAWASCAKLRLRSSLNLD